MPRKITSPCACRGSADLVIVHRGVALGRENRLVAQQPLHRPKVVAAAVGTGGKSVPQIMRRPVARQRAGDQPADVIRRQMPTHTVGEQPTVAGFPGEQGQGEP